MKKIIPLLILFLAPAAFAQGRPRPGDGELFTLSSEFSGRDGFDSRSAGIKTGFPLGGLGGYRLSASADAAHRRYFTAGSFPQELYDASLGLRAAGGKWSFGGGARSNSDRPYNSLSETDLSLDASTALSRRGPHSFMLGFSYSSRRSFLRGVPFPYISYSYVSEKLSVFFPFMLKWKPRAGGELSVSYFPPRYFTLGYSQKLSEVLTLGVSGSLQFSQYLLAGRADKNYALFLEQPHAGLRTDITPAKGWQASLWTAWGFRGRYFSGRQYDDRHGITRIGAGPIAGLSLKKLFGPLPERPKK